MTRAEELAAIDEAVAAGKVRRFPMGGAFGSGEEAVAFLRARGYVVTQRLGSYRCSTVRTGMNGEEIMRYAAYVRLTDSYPTHTAKHAAMKADFAAKCGLTPRKRA